MNDKIRKIKRLRLSMSLTGAIVATAVGVLLPVILSTSVGIAAIVMGKGTWWTTFGVLVISFAAAAIGGGIVVTVLLSRRHRLARLQADFVANITHELRTPLTSIKLYAQTMQSGRISDNPELLTKSVNTILREAEWLETMIDRVLIWRAASKDRLTPNMKTTVLSKTVQQAADRFERMIAIDEVDFLINLECDKEFSHDEQAITSIVINLLVNAYKYTTKHKKIMLSLTKSNNKIILSVEDNGIGIPLLDSKKIFEPFYRANSKLSSKAAGAGLGLAIVKYQVELHGGNISVANIQNGGAKFTIVFDLDIPRDN